MAELSASFRIVRSLTRHRVVKEEQGHKFHGNQHTGSLGGTDGTPPRQSDPNRYQVGGDRFQASQEGTTPPAAPSPNAGNQALIRHVKTLADAEGIMQRLSAGESPLVGRAAYPEFLRQVPSIPGQEPIDIVNLHLAGTFLIGHGGKGIPRVEMPQVPEERRGEFLDWLQKEKGFSTDKTSVNPERLLPIQKEINGRGVAHLFGVFSKAGKVPDTNRILVTRDGYVLDGHHNWAAAVALHVANPHTSLPVYRINCTWKEALDAGHEWDQQNGIEGQSMTSIVAKVLEIMKAGGFLVSKRHSFIEQASSALSVRANHLRGSMNDDTEGAAKEHEALALEHDLLGKKLVGPAAEAHHQAAQAHKAAADQIRGILPSSGYSIASNALMGDRARAYSARAAHFSNDALQETINHFDPSMVRKEVVENPDPFAPDAQSVIGYHQAKDVSYRAIGQRHMGIGLRHGDFADRLNAKAMQLRAANKGQDTPESRLYLNAAVAHRDAQQSHYRAGRTNDEAAYNGSKVEGAVPAYRQSRKNTTYATDAAAKASAHADALTNLAINYRNSADA